MPNLRPLALALSLSIIAAMAAPAADAAPKKKAAAKKSAVAALTACTDLYTFANKSWLDANVVPSGAASVTALGQLQALAQQQQLQLLDSAMRSPQGNVQQLLGDFWASGLDEAAVERDGANPIAPLLTRINAIKRSGDVAASIAALHQLGIPVAFDFSPDVDLNDLSRHVGYFAQGGLGLPDPAYYTRTDEPTRLLLGSYVAYVQKILALTGTPADQVGAQAQQVIDVETRIARVSRPVVDLRDPRNNFALIPTAGIGKQFKRLQLDDFLKAQGVTDDSVSMVNPAYFTELDTLVGSLKAEQWKTYLRFQVGNAMAPYLSNSFRAADFDFRGRILRGDAVPAPRQQQVLDAINRAAGPMVGREYVARYLPAATRERAEVVAKQVRDALERGIAANTWMEPATKAEAKAKLDKLKIEIGAPRRDIDYTVQPMGRGSFGGNMLIASTWHHREEMKRIGRGNADRRWSVLPQQPSIAYDIAQNRLIVTAAVLQAPVLDMAGSPQSHYGTFGGMVGHEISHAVDNRGRLVDAAGAVRTWWTPADLAAWTERSSKLATQFNAYPVPGVPNARVNGTLTSDENMADLAGIELAQSAMLAAGSTDKPASEALYSGWAKVWAQQLSPEAAQLAASTSVLAPGQWRTNGPLANAPQFADTYACKAGAPMLRKVEEQVSIWR